MKRTLVGGSSFADVARNSAYSSRHSEKGCSTPRLCTSRLPAERPRHRPRPVRANGGTAGTASRIGSHTRPTLLQPSGYSGYRNTNRLKPVEGAHAPSRLPVPRRRLAAAKFGLPDPIRCGSRQSSSRRWRRERAIRLLISSRVAVASAKARASLTWASIRSAYCCSSTASQVSS